MKKGIKTLLVLALAAAFICAMAVTSFAKEEKAYVTLHRLDGSELSFELKAGGKHLHDVGGSVAWLKLMPECHKLAVGDTEDYLVLTEKGEHFEIKDITLEDGAELYEVETSVLDPVGGNPADCGRAGYREAYKCGVCKLYFEDVNKKILIGDAEDYEAWKLEEGYLAPTGNHRWNKGEVQKDGSTLYTCEVCGATKVEPGKGGVATGDAENMAFYALLAIGAMAAAGFTVYKKER